MSACQSLFALFYAVFYFTALDYKTGGEEIVSYIRLLDFYLISTAHNTSNK